MIHEDHWSRLASLSPDDVCQRTGAQYNPENGCYTLQLLNRQVRVDPVERTVQWCDEELQAASKPGHDVVLLAAVYLIEAKNLLPIDDWVTAETLPSGTFFFRGLHALPTAQVATRFGHERDLFLKAGGDLGGKQADWGDASFEVQVLPRVAVRLVLWLGDEEIPARSTMLFDRKVDDHLPLDALGCMARHVIVTLVRTADTLH